MTDTPEAHLGGLLQQFLELDLRYAETKIKVMETMDADDDDTKQLRGIYMNEKDEALKRLKEMKDRLWEEGKVFVEIGHYAKKVYGYF